MMGVSTTTFSTTSSASAASLKKNTNKTAATWEDSIVAASNHSNEAPVNNNNSMEEKTQEEGAIDDQMEEDLSKAIEQLPDPHLRGLMSLCFTKYKAGEFTKQEMSAALALETAVEKGCVDGINKAMAAFDGLTLTTATTTIPEAPARVVRTRSADTASSVSTVSVNKEDFDDGSSCSSSSCSSSSCSEDDDEDESIDDSGSEAGGPPRIIMVPREAMMGSPTLGRKVGTPRHGTSRKTLPSRSASIYSTSGETAHTRVSVHEKIEEIEARQQLAASAAAALDATCHTRCSVVSQHIQGIEGKLSTHSRSLRRSNSIVMEAIKDIEGKLLGSKVKKGILTALRTLKTRKDKHLQQQRQQTSGYA